MQNIKMADHKPKALSERPTSTLRHICPICNDRARVRDGDDVTPLVREYYFQCLNVDCGATWKSQMAILYLLSPSAIHNPDVNIPSAPEGTVRKIFPPPGTELPDPRQIPMFDQD